MTTTHNYPPTPVPSNGNSQTIQIEVARSWRVGIRTAGDSHWVFNGLCFGIKEHAEHYADYLQRRWALVINTTVEPCADMANAEYPVPSDRYNVKRPEGGR